MGQIHTLALNFENQGLVDRHAEAFREKITIRKIVIPLQYVNFDTGFYKFRKGTVQVEMRRCDIVVVFLPELKKVANDNDMARLALPGRKQLDQFLFAVGDCSRRLDSQMGVTNKISRQIHSINLNKISRFRFFIFLRHALHRQIFVYRNRFDNGSFGLLHETHARRPRRDPADRRKLQLFREHPLRL